MLAVDRAAAVPRDAAEFPAVAAALHNVADAGDGVLQPERHPGFVDATEADEFGADLRGKLGSLLVGVHDQQAAFAGDVVGQPRVGGQLFSALDRAAIDNPAVPAVVLQRGLVTLAQPE